MARQRRLAAHASEPHVLHVTAPLQLRSSREEAHAAAVAQLAAGSRAQVFTLQLYFKGTDTVRRTSAPSLMQPGAPMAPPT